MWRLQPNNLPNPTGRMGFPSRQERDGQECPSYNLALLLCHGVSSSESVLLVGGIGGAFSSGVTP